jgi:hypothetical protein
MPLIVRIIPNHNKKWILHSDKLFILGCLLLQIIIHYLNLLHFSGCIKKMISRNYKIVSIMEGVQILIEIRITINSKNIWMLLKSLRMN